MSIPVVISIANPDPDVAPVTFSDAVAEFRLLITGILADDLTPYVLGFATPAVEDQDKVWHKVDSLGRPVGTFVFYNGNWRREYTGAVGEIKIFFGDPTAFFNSNGSGKIGLDWDGWFLMDGQDGRANLSDLILIGGRMDNAGITGYNTTTGLWETNVTGAPGTHVGSADITLTEAQIPTAASPPDAFVSPWVATGGKTRDEGGTNLSGALWGGTGDGSHTEIPLVAGDAGNATPTPVTIIPPVWATAFVQFGGYEII